MTAMRIADNVVGLSIYISPTLYHTRVLHYIQNYISCNLAFIWAFYELPQSIFYN